MIIEDVPLKNRWGSVCGSGSLILTIPIQVDFRPGLIENFLLHISVDCSLKMDLFFMCIFEQHQQRLINYLLICD